ncbi:NUDIX domain-containing protein [Kribbella ginsengisoli]|uniref:NUDIX domain-containing protein n=1 Tax=Kribbella ginsengisoli TaxID=363865 RepID=UPI0031DB31B0
MRRSVECWMTGEQGRVLLLHVSAEEVPPEGFWQPLTGGIKGDETAAQAVAREVFEETGQVVGEGEFRFVADGIRVKVSADFEVVKSLFVVRLPSQVVTVEPSEHDDFRWVEPGEVSGLLHWESNRETWEQVQKVL